MRRCLLIAIPIIFLGKVHAQNLLANGNFDDKNICIEYRAGCAPEAWFRIPLAPVAINGETHNQYVSFVMENVFEPFGSRSYIYTRLLCNLTAGKKYRFTAWLRANENPFDHTDVLMVPYEPNRNKKLLPSAKQKFTITNQQKTQNRPGGWNEYAVEFVARGDERYLIIGNFAKEPLTNVSDGGDGSGKIRYDIDNVSLFPEDSTEAACPEWKTNKILLYQNNPRHTPGSFMDEDPPYIEPVVKIPVVVNDTLVIPDVLFKFNSADLNPKFTKGLDTLVTKIKGRTFKRMEVIGHTDSLGTHAFNAALSLHRAETVKNYLASRLQYPATSISANGKAALLPVATNTTAAGRQKNRRVEIILIR